MKFKFLLLITLLGCLHLPALAQEDETSLSIKPGLVRMENEDLTIGVDFNAKVERVYTFTSEYNFPRIIEIDFNAQGTLLTKPEFNPNHQQANFFLGYLVSFKKAQEITLGNEDQEESTDYGTFGLGITAAYEADQTFSEQNIEQGLELRYSNSSQLWLPTLELSYLFVKPFRSDIRDDLSVNPDFFRRYEFRALWGIVMNRFMLSPEFRYFKSLDLSAELKDAGLDEGFHSSVELGYMFADRESGFLTFFDYAYLQYNRGQFPVYLDNRETIEAGISFKF
jgi:hypothetical protein